jgi:hypothetical protein
MSKEAYEACLADLGARGVVFKALGAVAEQGCRLDGAVSVEAVRTRFGMVRLTGQPVMLCGFARGFAGWTADLAAPLTLAYLGAPLATIETGSGLACRLRNGASEGKISEHAKGNALDLAAFVLAGGRRVGVKAGAGDEAAEGYLRALRSSACGSFTTVLGPGSNAAHADHLHVDLGLHGRSANYRICE